MKTAIILAGGKGTRLGEDLPPKAMLDVQGKTLIQRQLEWLVSENFEKIVLCLGHRADEVSYESPAQISTSYEETPLGTAGAVRKAYFDNGLTEPAYVLNVDDLATVNTDEAFKTATDRPVVVTKPIPYSCITPEGTFHKQNICGTHIGHHVLRQEDIMKLPEKGDLPTWLSQNPVRAYVTNAEWKTINTPEQLTEANK